MKKWVLSLSLAAGVIGLAACGNNGDVVVKTKSGNVTKDELYEAMKDKVGDQVVQQLVLEKVLSDKYKVSDKEVDKQVDQTKKQLGDQFEMALQQAGIKDEKEFRNNVKLGLLQEKAATKDLKITDKDIKDYYANSIKPDIKASHILVADEKTAKEVEAKLKKGEKFEDLAKKYSTDGTAQKGGDLGWFNTGKMDPTFEAAAYKLKVNEVSEPVKTQFGYHIIKKTGEKDKAPLDDKMKKEIKEKIKASKVDQTKLAEVMKKEIKDAKLDIKDKDLKKSFDNVLNSDTSSSTSKK
ncbi:peptidylprolyl isomerase [Bacillus sporothermodurans]|uniref:peptidylprolyl isomerase n=1 Tax=Heyndrickxia sporothermodurans TaxID=46224 RepID=UPI00192C7F10|nr:peptidylprolyl isomerase [Heyndrickxia sporothermodurans]MBL5814304.1 peptidylprolyl isomerase [Heyndrickxia sporothermodurans]